MPKKADVDTIKKFLDDLWAQAQGMLSKGRVSTEKVAQSAKLKMDLYLLSGKKEDLFQKLGEAFYTTSKRKKPSSKNQQLVMSLLQEIKEIETHEKSLKKDISKKAVKTAATRPRRGRPPKRKKPGRKKKTAKSTK